MNRKACVSAREEQLYILEVFVDRVILYTEKFEKIDPVALGVDLKFPELPLFRIFQTEFQLTKQERKKCLTRDDKNHVVKFHAGKMYLFTRNPSNLIETVKSSPLMVDVYKIKAVLKCPHEVLKEPLGETKVPLPGCLCDQITMAENDVRHLPKSYEVKNTFCLIDEERRPSGLITLLIRLTCCGKSIMSEFSIVSKKLLFQNDGSFNEFLCVKVNLPDEEERRAAEIGRKKCLPDEKLEESELEAPPRSSNVTGLVLICQELAKIDGYPPNIVPSNKKSLTNAKFSKNNNKQNKGQEELNNQRHVHSNNIIQRQVTFQKGPCTSVGCAGSLCTGIKKS